MSDESNGTLSRWSQRKLAARHGAVIDEPPPDKKSVTPPVTAGENSAATAAEAETETPELPPIDELTFESDYTGFLHKSVPEALRRAALRKLWASDPLFGFIDGLDDYCEDFNVIDTPITLAQTSYKVGRGYLDEVKEAVSEVESEVAKLGPENVGQAPSESSAESLDEQTAEEDSVADDAPDESRQLAAAAPEPDDIAENSGKLDGGAPTVSESGQRRGS